MAITWSRKLKYHKDYQLTKQPLFVEEKFKYALYHKKQIKQTSCESNDIWCNPSEIKQLKTFLQSVPDSFNNLVIAGNDDRLSGQIHSLQDIKHRFNKIYYEAKDVECDWVQTIPMGVNLSYMLRNGGNEILLPHINKQKNKTKLIASAFGSKWPDLVNRIADRKLLRQFTQTNNFIDDMFCPPHEYYERLCDYRYFASPLGAGVQTPKICECIMCETVPVVTDHVAHRELRDIYGLPLLIMNEWNDLTEEFLNDQWDYVYSKIDWDEQKSKFLTKNFNKLLI